MGKGYVCTPLHPTYDDARTRRDQPTSREQDLSGPIRRGLTGMVNVLSVAGEGNIHKEPVDCGGGVHAPMVVVQVKFRPVVIHPVGAGGRFFPAA